MRRKQKGDKFEALRSHPNLAFLLLPPKPTLTFDSITNLMSLNFSLPFCLIVIKIAIVLHLKSIFTKKQLYFF